VPRVVYQIDKRQYLSCVGVDRDEAASGGNAFPRDFGADVDEFVL